jgi:shikimate dehydrogenase
MPAEGARRRAAVLGHPVAHSLSPVLHHAAYAELGLAWDYDRMDVTGPELARLLDSLDPSWAGLSLTMPLKRDVIPLLDEVDSVAAATGAVNTVVLRDGRRLGFNTDVEGLVEALRERGRIGASPSAAVVGGGATARSAIAALARLGARSVSVCLRRPDALRDLKATADAVGVTLEALPWDRADEALAADLVVCTVPAHAADGLVASVPEHPGLLLDVVYDPWPTALAAAWAGRGGPVASGLDLLLHQAVGQVRLMTGREVSVEALRASLEAAARAR